MTATEPLPAAVADLIRRGNDEAARKRREAEDAKLAKEMADLREARVMLDEIRVSVVKADIGLTPELAEFLTVDVGCPVYLRANGYVTMKLVLPGCTPVVFNVARRSAPGVGFGIGNAGESWPFRPVRRTGLRFDTLGEAVAAAREFWLDENKAA